MDAQENKKIVKEIVKDLLCVAPNFGKKITRSIFKKDLKYEFITNSAEALEEL